MNFIRVEIFILFFQEAKCKLKCRVYGIIHTLLLSVQEQIYTMKVSVFNSICLNTFHCYGDILHFLYFMLSCLQKWSTAQSGLLWSGLGKLFTFQQCLVFTSTVSTAYALSSHVMLNMCSVIWCAQWLLEITWSWRSSSDKHVYSKCLLNISLMSQSHKVFEWPKAITI